MVREKLEPVLAPIEVELEARLAHAQAQGGPAILLPQKEILLDVAVVVPYPSHATTTFLCFDS